MKPIEHAFLDSILARPDDDAPRLIYADWLEEDGQEEWAEFIRVQCALAHLKPVPAHWPGLENFRQRRQALRRRERELLPALWPAFWQILWPAASWSLGDEPPGPLRPVAVFRRGFVEEITIALADWLRHGPALVKVAPLREVRLSDCQPMRQRAGRF